MCARGSYFLIMSLVMLLFLTSTASGAGNIPVGPLVVPADVLNRFLTEGHTASDIYTAQDLADKTAVPIEQWLSLKKAGKTWLEAISILHGDKTIPVRRLDPSGRQLSQAEILSFMYEGYSGPDITEAGNITYVYGSDPKKLLERNRSGESWQSIRDAEDRLWREKYYGGTSGPPRPHVPSAGPFLVSSELLDRYLEHGVHLHDVIVALDVQHRTRMVAEDTLSQRRSGKAWSQIIEPTAGALSRRSPDPVGRTLTPEEVTGFQATGYAPRDILEAADITWLFGADPSTLLHRKVSGYTWDSLRQLEEANWWNRYYAQAAKPSAIFIGTNGTSLITTSGLHIWEIYALMEKGFASEDILKAAGLAFVYGVDFAKIASSTEPGAKLESAVRVAYQSTSAESRIASQRERLATSLGLTLAQFYERPWVTLSTVHSQLGITEHEINTIIRQGHELRDVLLAAELACALGVDIKAVSARLKQGQDWFYAVVTVSRRPRNSSPSSLITTQLNSQQ